MNDDVERCPGTNRQGEPCGHPAGWGTDHDEGPCKFHGGAADNRGKKNGNYKHGAFSEHLRSSLTDQEAAALDELAEDLADPEVAVSRIREQAAEAYIKYERSGDDRFLREYRQLLSTFNIVEAPDQLEVEHSGQIDGERTLGDDELAAIREGLAASGDSDT